MKRDENIDSRIEDNNYIWAVAKLIWKRKLVPARANERDGLAHGGHYWSFSQPLILSHDMYSELLDDGLLLSLHIAQVIETMSKRARDYQCQYHRRIG